MMFNINKTILGWWAMGFASGTIFWLVWLAIGTWLMERYVGRFSGWFVDRFLK